jgi:hypothetical protein
MSQRQTVILPQSHNATKSQSHNATQSECNKSQTRTTTMSNCLLGATAIFYLQRPTQPIYLNGAISVLQCTELTIVRRRQKLNANSNDIELHMSTCQAHQSIYKLHKTSGGNKNYRKDKLQQSIRFLFSPVDIRRWPHSVS